MTNVYKAALLGLSFFGSSCIEPLPVPEDIAEARCSDATWVTTISRLRD